MKVALFESRESSGKNRFIMFMLIEDDGSEDGGRLIAKFSRKDEALDVCKAMGWEVIDET